MILIRGKVCCPEYKVNPTSLASSLHIILKLPKYLPNEIKNFFKHQFISAVLFDSLFNLIFYSPKLETHCSSKALDVKNVSSIFLQITATWIVFLLISVFFLPSKLLMALFHESNAKRWWVEGWRKKFLLERKPAKHTKLIFSPSRGPFSRIKMKNEKREGQWKKAKEINGRQAKLRGLMEDGGWECLNANGERLSGGMEAGKKCTRGCGRPASWVEIKSKKEKKKLPFSIYFPTFFIIIVL